jgi:hypothetical protein
MKVIDHAPPYWKIRVMLACFLGAAGGNHRRPVIWKKMSINNVQRRIYDSLTICSA